MSNLFEEFKQTQKGIRAPEESLFPLMCWFSSKEGNIEAIQKINKRYMFGNRKIYITELTLNINVKGFMRFPKKSLKTLPVFFLRDIGAYYGWTIKEVLKNIDILDFSFLNSSIPKIFAYDKKELKEIEAAQK